MIKILRLCILTLLLESGLAVAVTEQEHQLAGLEAVQAWEAAYPVALQLADQRGNYAAWRQVAAQYAAYDHRGLAYLKAWQHADRDQREDQYRDCATLRPDTELSAMALHRALLAIDHRPDNDDKAKAYIDFVNAYPHHPESLVALSHLHSMAYARTVAVNTVAAYDRFAATFPEAEQARLAEEAARKLEHAQLTQDLQGADLNRRAQVATQLYTQALEDELTAKSDPSQSQRYHFAQRKLSLLQEMLKDTEAYQKHLTRLEINRNFAEVKQLVQDQGSMTREHMEDMRQALTAIITAQNRQLQEHIAVQGQTLHDAITTYQQVMEKRLLTVTDNLAQLHGRLEETQRRLIASQSQPGCKHLVDCALRVALEVLPSSSAFKLGVSLLDKLPAITRFLHLG